MRTKILLPAILLLLFSCSEHHQHLATYELRVDFQSVFENDHVQLIIGKSYMLDRDLETNHLLGVCTDGGQLSYALPEGSHELTVTVNNNLSKSEVVVLDRARYVGVSYDRHANEISFQVSDEPFGYD